MRWCSALNCTNNSCQNPGKKFFCCPKDKKKCKKWIQNSRRQDLLDKSTDYCYVNIYFCADHFEDSNFMNSNKDKLVWFAAPATHRSWLFYVLFSLAITASVQLVGVYLVFASLIIPTLAEPRPGRRALPWAT